MVAESRDLDSHQFGGANHQRALGDADFDAVDGQCHHLRLAYPDVSVGRLGHASTPFATSMESRGSNGQPPPSTWARYSSRKCLIDDITGLAAPSPNAQNDFPKMESEMSNSLSMSSWLPRPVSSRS
ncbi:Uncharacterised protein [Mycobacterium tuberculosis]|uniref:Uncharacterized protein n=1 Tax=Mycobacterium tuberculosis TaxID=1773 RepID=A0A916LFT4_MYCTX|nr:Uncharacterised protein [Mycobacterium tuberculosis]